MPDQNARTHDDFDPLMDATLNEPSMQERVELIIHLLRHSDRLFTIMSDDSTILSGFSHKLTHHDTQGLHYAEVYPTAGMDAEDIVMHLARGWNVDVDFGETAMNALFHRLPAMLPEPRRAVAIVHFTDTLPPAILDALISFMQRLDQLLNGRVRMILTGSPQLTQRLAPMQTLSGVGQVYALHLQSLSPNKSPAQGFVTPEAADLFTSDDATSAPSSAPPRATPPRAANNGSGPRSLILGGLGVSLILAVVVALMLRPDTPEPPKDTTVSIPLTPTVTPTVTAAPPLSPSEATAPSADTTTPPAEKPAQIATPTPNPEPTPAPVTTPVVSPAPVAVASPTQPSVYAATPVVSPADTAAPSAHVASKPAAEAKPEKKPETKTAAKSSTSPPSQRFSKENAQHYVLQIVTLGSAKAASSYIKAHGLENCQTFHQQRDGKDLFSLTCGLYPNREAALEAQKNLPSSVLSTKPYPRQIADIRKVMQP